MLDADPNSLVGSTLLSGLRVEQCVHSDAALATYLAISEPDGMQCTLRVALGIELAQDRDEAVATALQRLSRHSVGIFELCPPKAAGPVTLGSKRLLAVAHVGSPRDSAQDRIASGSPLALDELLGYLEPLAIALTTLHDQGLVHGAIHPAAVRLARSGPVLSGFGLSELAILLNGSVGGRDVLPPRYRTPEQVGIVPASPTPESDTYALGMLACELLAGRPFTAEPDAPSIARAIDHPMVRPTPRTLSVVVQDHVEQAFSIALRTQPRERTTTPKSFLASLASPAAAATASPQPTPLRKPEPEHTTAQAPVSRRQPPAQAPAPPQRSVFGPQGQPPVIPAEPSSAIWLVYALIGLGALLLVGGAATIFVLAQRRTPVAVPVVSAPTAFPTPPPPPVATAPPQPEPLDPSAPTASAPPTTVPPSPSAPSSSVRPTAPLTGVPYYPEDLTALVPLSKDTPILGNRNALVTLMLFADMQCVHTRHARQTVEALRRRYDSDLRIAVRHLPIPSHDKAELAAEIAATTGALAGPMAFWKLFDTLTTNQGALTDSDMLQWADQSGAQLNSVRRALEEHVYARIVDSDRALAQRLMVRATPTFFINGKRMDGEQQQPVLEAFIDKELGASRAALSAGTTHAKLYSARVLFNVTAGASDPPSTSPQPRRRP